MFTPDSSKPDRTSGVQFKDCAHYNSAAQAARAGYEIGGYHPGIYNVRDIETGDVIRFRVSAKTVRKCKEQY